MSSSSDLIDVEIITGELEKSEHITIHSAPEGLLFIPFVLNVRPSCAIERSPGIFLRKESFSTSGIICLRNDF